jgi:signal peptidase I
MSKKPQKSPNERSGLTKESAVASQQTHAVRETVESIVIAFVLAFLFRTFEAEAFVIPTGSMAPTLMGMHKDVFCPKCGHRFQVGASIDEGGPFPPPAQEVAAGVCPMCRYLVPMERGLPLPVPDTASIENRRSYNGDRILVNKFLDTFSDPERYSVVVFHFPGNAEVNYIKRLVGLPGETLRIFQGDLLVRGPHARDDEDFAIAAKPADVFLSVRQLVHDTNYDSAELVNAGWPLRWYASAPTGADGWQVEKKVVGGNAQQRYTVDRTGGGEAWLRYRHIVPDYHDWLRVAQLQAAGASGGRTKFTDAELGQLRPQLIVDFNAYNARAKVGELWDMNGQRRDMKQVLAQHLGLHWVGDLMVEAKVDVEEAKGDLLLDLVEGGKHFTCRIDLTTGQATLSAAGANEFNPSAATPVTSAGTYRIGFANFDDQLMLWVNGRLIPFDASTAYNATAVFEGRSVRPQTSGSNRTDLDLSPVGIGARGANLAVTDLKIWRDIYYIADSSQIHDRTGAISDYERFNEIQDEVLLAPSDPGVWETVFSRRRHVDFPLGNDQYFVMGDNSAESSDARLWRADADRGTPGGAYLERKLLIGKAVCVYWPHAWYTIPKTRIPVWPNFRDMRLVR